MEEAAAYTKVCDFAKHLEQGLDTPLSEGGKQLSAGQRQLVSLARAIACHADLVILDEATADIDAFTERDVQEVLERILQDKTVLVVAHRLSTIRSADKILVMHQGRLVEEGKHEELMALKGYYEKLYRLSWF